MTSPPTSDLEVHQFTDSMSTCTLLVLPDSKVATTILIDCGSALGVNSVRSRARAFVHDALRRVRPDGAALNYVVLTQPDPAHHNLLLPSLQGIPVGNVVYGGHLDQYAPDIRDWIKGHGIAARGFPAAHSDIANPLIRHGLGKVFVLAANATGNVRSPDTATNSLVLLTTYGSLHVIHWGDATAATGRFIRANHPTLCEKTGPADLTLLTGHPGDARQAWPWQLTQASTDTVLLDLDENVPDSGEPPRRRRHACASTLLEHPTHAVDWRLATTP
ncbi:MULTISPECIES: hypothetical protein [Streptomyces]|uniref:MBL fold metallo-hydrolase n=3 Tax=Streptomyces TaxID=1883 RepID=A0A3S9PBS4_STRLT|nr:hypothetical protein [Streptomyces luteoverticillatus]AZQ69839.1 hypothetical protein EKH77_00125 [Streptomyces luteoverticillatus]